MGNKRQFLTEEARSSGELIPIPLILPMLGLTVLYVLATEIAKKYFCSRSENAIA